jgi:hypothetical protein
MYACACAYARENRPIVDVAPKLPTSWGSLPPEGPQAAWDGREGMREWTE